MFKRFQKFVRITTEEVRISLYECDFCQVIKTEGSCILCLMHPVCDTEQLSETSHNIPVTTYQKLLALHHSMFCHMASHPQVLFDKEF
jgi:hypothetical protein